MGRQHFRKHLEILTDAARAEPADRDPLSEFFTLLSSFDPC
jgi:hypothetical protein